MAEQMELTWFPVAEQLPDEGSLVLVYCQSLDDVVFGYTGRDPVLAEKDELIWLNSADGNQILQPLMWADVPFPPGI